MALKIGIVGLPNAGPSKTPLNYKLNLSSGHASWSACPVVERSEYFGVVYGAALRQSHYINKEQNKCLSLSA